MATMFIAFDPPICFQNIKFDFYWILVLIIAPFVFCIIELKQLKDLVSLDVNLEYTKDVSYFQKSFIKTC